MGHNLFHDQMAYVGKPPWHGLGEEVPEGADAKKMCSAAGLDWRVTKEPVPGARIINRKTKAYDRYLVARDPVGDEKSPVAFGLVTRRYELLQNTEAFAFFEPFIESRFASFHTAGALGNGERVWVLAKLNGDMTIAPGDDVQRFLLLSNSHDGSAALTIRFTPIRVVCKNTLNLAMKRKSGVISIRHTKNLSTNLTKAQAQELTRVIEKVYAAAQALFRKMAERNLVGEEPALLLEAVFPKQAKGEEPERWSRIRQILADSNATLRDTKDTLWGFYNAIVRDEDYRETRGQVTAEARLSRVWFGSGSDLKLKALDVCRDFLKKAAA